jgi:hypothetical protein
MYIASVCAGQALRALEALLTEIARLRLHGINDRQFEQVGNNLVHCHGTGTTSDYGWMVLQWLGWRLCWWLQALADIRSDIENTWLERDQSYCWDIRDEYCRNFLEGEMVTGRTHTCVWRSE